MPGARISFCDAGLYINVPSHVSFGELQSLKYTERSTETKGNCSWNCIIGHYLGQICNARREKAKQTYYGFCDETNYKQGHFQMNI
ncbi:uncharacterized protein LOC116431935 isoform X1 [Nomia melanderi]|uniref:uncharacterized protein LOC116431935 isoform X1 n=2 Tax=Nomia melanderi TaxID=2448451 RepID=UPI003FCE2558